MTTQFIEGRLRAPAHDVKGVPVAENFLDRLNIHSLDGYDLRAQTLALVREHMRPGQFYEERARISDGAFRRLAQRCELELLYCLVLADVLGCGGIETPLQCTAATAAAEWFIKRARELNVERKAPEHILMGCLMIEMGFQPFPFLGRVLRAVFDM